ncbi:MAG TPA: PhnD/SsuA/transferrin family substrate-binding protein [Dokdonella sp.]|uniref:phosphate/phosphite/phosphonate ABC transporter substrate-binding protein n=1 Tax=Dokdonella sp. TaxID=2291710 RepID=UPI002D7F19B7|nr:PhnD/SsuA/transferrin family substrate-binding protein [Dokdonella sp.]HET9034538.1 PhnD/SsuA/transferrin family substrate-binding protein [Dokdonella sp.]
MNHMNRFRSRSFLVIALVGAALAAGNANSAEYRFTPEPNFTPTAAELIYKPLLDYLGKATGEKFVLTPAANYSSYWRDILKPDQTDFSYDEAHFADYRISHLKFIPLVRRFQPSSYTLLANPDFEGKDPKALLSARIATMPAPSLGYAVLMQIYPNPVQQPEIKSSATSWRDNLGILNSGETEAAIFPTWMLETYGNPSLVSLFTSPELPGPTILASPNVPEDVRNKVRDALLNTEDAPELGELLLELGISKFIPAKASDYAGDEKILSGFYGYVK